MNSLRSNSSRPLNRKIFQQRVILQESIEKMEADTERREELIGQRDTCRAELDTVRQKATEDREHRQQLAVRENSLTTQLVSIREGIGRLEVQFERLQERREQLREAFNIKEDPSEGHKVELEAQLEARLVAESELGEARANVEAIEHQMREQEQLRGEVENEVQTIQHKLEKQRIAAQEISTLSRTIEEQIIEKQGNLESLLDSLEEDAAPVDWEEKTAINR